MSKYKENMDEREEIFNTRKRDLIEKNNLEVEQKQAELAELEKNKDQVKELADVLEAEDPWLNRQQTKSSESSHVVEPVNLVEELNKAKKLTIN